MKLASSQKGIQHGATLSGFMTSSEQVIFSAYSNRADGILHRVVIDI
jgi:hypothetical protein